MAALQSRWARRVRGAVIGIGIAATALVAAASGAARRGLPLQDWPATGNVPPVDRSRLQEAETRAQQILEGLTLDQKIGQMTQGEIQAVEPADVARYCLGSVISGGGSWPDRDKHASPEEWRDLADAYWQAGVDGCGIPPIWGIDSVHGNSNVIGATLFPHNIGLGAANDPELVRKIGTATARETRATGQPWVFAPVVAVARDDRWGRTYESYSEDPRIVARLARPLIEGLQGQLGECDVAATAKHWIGDGGTTEGRDRGNAEVSEEELINIHGLAYFEALDAGVLSVMPSFSSWNDERLHGHRYLVTDILKDRLGFGGHVISDWNAIGQVPDCTTSDCPQAVAAGIDLFMVPDEWREFLVATRQQVLDGVIPMQRIDDGVRRILRNKVLLGLFEQRPSESECAIDSELGSAAGRELARKAVRKSLVLLKNDDATLPLARDARILVTGKSARNIANQSGGWSVTWQGTGNSNLDFPGATSIYDGIAAVAPLAEHVPFVNNVDRNRYDVAIAVIGETPYAEGLGDIRSNQTLEHARLHPEDLAVLQRLHESGIPVVTVWIAGRPLYANKEINLSDAFVAAWLPGSEGGGIADVLFADADGEVNHDFTGKLSFSWPASACQTPVNAGDGRQPLFPLGHGLTYRDTVTLDTLDEASIGFGCAQLGSDIDAATDPLEIFVQGGNIAPHELRIADPSNWDGVPVDLSDPNNVTALRNVAAGPRVDSPDFQFGGLNVSFGIGTEGVGTAQFYSQVTDQPRDLRAYLNSANGALVFDVRADAPPTFLILTRIDCEYPCSGQLFLNSTYAAVSDGDWHELAIPLGCFAVAGADFSRITAPFLLVNLGQWDPDFANIRWEPDQAGNVTCDGLYDPGVGSGLAPGAPSPVRPATAASTPGSGPVSLDGTPCSGDCQQAEARLQDGPLPLGFPRRSHADPPVDPVESPRQGTTRKSESGPLKR